VDSARSSKAFRFFFKKLAFFLLFSICCFVRPELLEEKEEEEEKGTSRTILPLEVLAISFLLDVSLGKDFIHPLLRVEVCLAPLLFPPLFPGKPIAINCINPEF
jgi:hypothetical protein